MDRAAENGAAAVEAASTPATAAPDGAPPSPPASAREATAAATDGTPEAPAPDYQWFDSYQLARFEDAQDENELAKRIMKLEPGASREEILFRYTLSRTVYFQEFELPVLPATAAEILRLGRNARSTVQDYVGVIQGDPSLVSATIRLSNSSFFSAVNECSSLERAIVRVGTAEVEKIAMVHTFNSKLFRVPGHGKLVERLVEHGVCASHAAQGISRELKIEGSEAFLAGLFHDVGKLILLQTIGEVQKRLNWKAPQPMVQSAFAAFHTRVGELLCSKWEFPPPIVAAVASHHDSVVAGASRLGQAVYLGNRLAHQVPAYLATIAEAEDEATPDEIDIPDWMLEDPVMLKSGLSAAQLLRILEQVAAQVPGYLGHDADRPRVTTA